MMSNSAGTLKWIGDGSEGGKLSSSSSSSSPSAVPSTTGGGSGSSFTTIAFASATHGTPFNIRLDDDDNNNGDDATSTTVVVADSYYYYYEVKVLDLSKESSLGVGLVTGEGFRPGWKTKGCFYNGNITNGSAGLIVGFGKSIKSGDTVGVYQQHEEEEGGDDEAAGRRRRRRRRCNIIFYHNGTCLGAGFSLEGVNDNEKFYPCLHLSGNAEVEYSVPSSPPTVFQREQQEPQKHDDPYNGEWMIVQAFSGPELGELPLPEKSRFKVSLERVDTTPSSSDGDGDGDSGETSAQYGIYVKISNSLRTSFSITGNEMEGSLLFDEIKFTGHCTGTRMRPSPEFQEMEYFIQSALSDDDDGGFKKMIISGEEGQLVMSGPTAEIICSRFVEMFEPVTSLK